MPATGVRNVHRAIAAHWVAAGLDLFVRNRRDSPADPYPTLFDSRAEPQPRYPFVVFVQDRGARPSRMSWSETESRETRSASWEFHVHARDKLQAGDVSEAIQEAFDSFRGCMQVGAIVSMDYESEFGMEEDESGQYTWIIKYNVRFEAKVNAN